MQQNKTLNLLGIAAKGGFIESGEFSVERSVKAGKARLVIVAVDSSDNTKKQFDDMCRYYRVPIYYYETKDKLGHTIGKEMRACVACTDSGLSRSIVKQLNDKEGKTGGSMHA